MKNIQLTPFHIYACVTEFNKFPKLRVKPIKTKSETKFIK